MKHRDSITTLLFYSQIKTLFLMLNALYSLVAAATQAPQIYITCDISLSNINFFCSNKFQNLLQLNLYLIILFEKLFLHFLSFSYVCWTLWSIHIAQARQWCWQAYTQWWLKTIDKQCGLFQTPQPPFWIVCNLAFFVIFAT